MNLSFTYLHTATIAFEFGMSCVLGQMTTCHPLLSGANLCSTGGEQSTSPGLPAKVVRTLTILVAWEIRKERNAIIFYHRHNTTEALIGVQQEPKKLFLLPEA